MQEISAQLMERIAARFKAMGNPARLGILHALEDGERSVTQILAAVGGSQANVSKHLKVLRAAGLVACRRDGVNSYYRISDEAVFAICRLVCDSLLHRAAAEVTTIEQGREAMLAGRG